MVKSGILQTPQNMFLAIINDTYAEVKSELSTETEEFAVMDYFKGMLSKLGAQKEQIEGIQAAIKVKKHRKLVFQNFTKISYFRRILMVHAGWALQPFDKNWRSEI